MTKGLRTLICLPARRKTITYSDQSPSRAPRAATRGAPPEARAACVSTWLGEDDHGRHLPDVAWPAARSAALWAFCRRQNAPEGRFGLNMRQDDITTNNKKVLWPLLPGFVVKPASARLRRAFRSHCARPIRIFSRARARVLLVTGLTRIMCDFAKAKSIAKRCLACRRKAAVPRAKRAARQL